MFYLWLLECIEPWAVCTNWPSITPPPPIGARGDADQLTPCKDSSLPLLWRTFAWYTHFYLWLRVVRYLFYDGVGSTKWIIYIFVFTIICPIAIVYSIYFMIITISSYTMNHFIPIFFIYEVQIYIDFQID